MTSLLLIGGLDPTGQAGLARDIAVCTQLGVTPCPVATAITVQTSHGVRSVQPTPPDVLQDMIEAAVVEHGSAWAKVGATFNAQQVEVILETARQYSLRIVVDPILAASTGTPFTTPSALTPLVAAAELATPNEEEAAALGLKEGAHVHITRGGNLPGRHRGTGCRLATHVACLLALGLQRDLAIAQAHQLLEAELAADAAAQALDDDRREHVGQARRALPAILAALRPEDIPEVGSNFAYAMAGAQDPRQDVAGLAGRITIAGFDRAVAGRVAIGGPHHTGRIAVVLQEYPGPGPRRAQEACIVINHRFDEQYLEHARQGGLVDVGFCRDDEPPDAPSSMEWGVRTCIDQNGGRIPDLVWDRGGMGKEAMIRVIAATPADLVDKLRIMHGRKHAATPGILTTPGQ